MLSRRLVVCLDVAAGTVVKGVHFEALRDLGDPVMLATRHEKDGADEIVFLNIAVSSGGGGIPLDVVRRTADSLFIPLTVGGGIRSVSDASDMLRAGADKVSINSAGVERPELFEENAERFGSQCVVASIDARREGKAWRVYTHGGRRRTGLDAVEWAARCAELGAGEILLTSIDRDGTRSGFDVDLIKSVAGAVKVPVIASGGGGRSEHVTDVLLRGGADAALMAGAIHDGTTSIAEIKLAMKAAGIRIREAA